MKEQIIEMRNEGKSYTEIARVLHISKSTVSKVLKENNNQNLKCTYTKVGNLIVIKSKEVK